MRKYMYSIGKRLVMTAVMAGLFSVSTWADGTTKPPRLCLIQVTQRG